MVDSLHPEVKWAQRPDVVYLTVMLPDAKDAKVNLDPEGVFNFSASAGAGDRHYELKLELQDKVNVEVGSSYLIWLHHWIDLNLLATHIMPVCIIFPIGEG